MSSAGFSSWGEAERLAKHGSTGPDISGFGAKWIREILAVMTLPERAVWVVWLD